jgi:hypothetical protein
MISRQRSTGVSKHRFLGRQSICSLLTVSAIIAAMLVAAKPYLPRNTTVEWLPFNEKAFRAALADNRVVLVLYSPSYSSDSALGTKFANDTVLARRLSGANVLTQVVEFNGWEAPSYNSSVSSFRAGKLPFYVVYTHDESPRRFELNQMDKLRRVFEPDRLGVFLISLLAVVFSVWSGRIKGGGGRLTKVWHRSRGPSP